MPRRRDLGSAFGSFFDTLGPLLDRQFEREQWDERNRREDRQQGYAAVNTALSNARQSGEMDPERLQEIGATVASLYGGEDIAGYADDAWKAYLPSLEMREAGAVEKITPDMRPEDIESVMARHGLASQREADVAPDWGVEGPEPEGPLRYQPGSLTSRLLEVPRQQQLQAWRQAQREGTGYWSPEHRWGTVMLDGGAVNIMREPRYDEPGVVDVYETTVSPFDPQRLDQIIGLMQSQGRTPDEIAQARELFNQGQGNTEAFARLTQIDQEEMEREAESIATTEAETATPPRVPLLVHSVGDCCGRRRPRGLNFLVDARHQEHLLRQGYLERSLRQRPNSIPRSLLPS